VVLLLATLGAVGYLYLSRSGSSSSATGFVGANQKSVKATSTVIAAAQGVQRFAELHAFDRIATAQIVDLFKQQATLQRVADSVSGRQKQIADESVTTVKQAVDAIGRYRKAVALTYRLSDAETAHQDLNSVVASLKQEAQAWQHS
jgi:hypothetical protein